MPNQDDDAQATSTADDSPAGPLSGITVIDLSHVYNGPYATFLMAMAGARVIKVEPPGGEHLRSRGDMGGAALPFAMLNSNKCSVTLNLKSTAGTALLRQMATRADVLVENFAPGVMDRLGIGAATLRALNPRLIYGSSSGYGKSGPYAQYPAMDLVMQAMSGVISVTGHPDQPPVKAGPALCDFSAGTHLYGAIMTALYQRERTGQGATVEVTMQDSVYASLASNLGMLHARGGETPPRTGNRHGGLGISPYNAYAACDGFVVINAPGDQHFRSILRVIGRSDLGDDPRFATRSARVANMAEVDAMLEEWTTRHGKEEIAERLLAAAVPCAPVRELAEVVLDRNMHARGSLQWVDHPDLGRVVLPHTPMHFENAERIPLQPSGGLGRDNRAVFGEWLGHSDEELATLAADGTI
jgi:CoA:oxalate CoA-transferase